jgi:septal ring factor EnvC (AmiA/AmiB activator)
VRRNASISIVELTLIGVVTVMLSSVGHAETPLDAPSGSSNQPSAKQERSDTQLALRAMGRRLDRATQMARAEANLRTSGSMQPNRAVGPLVRHDRDKPFRQLKGELARPIEGQPATIDFGRRQQQGSVSYVRHTGLTWRVDAGTDVRSVATGTVAWVGEMEGYGPLVMINHGDGYVSLYAHLETQAVEAGEEVQPGGVIGAVGEAGSLEGPKLYFEIRRGEQPIDPAPWLTPLPSEAEQESAGALDAGTAE